MGCCLYTLGAKFSPKIRFEGNLKYIIILTTGHVHRLFVSILLFGSIFHAVISLLTLMMFGFMAEKYIGVKKYILLLLVSGITGNLMSSVIYP